MAQEGYRLGNLPDDYDLRDRPIFSEGEVQNFLSAETSITETGHPKSFILSDLPPVYHQLNIGSCTANAACAALRYAHKKYSGKPFKDFEPSRLWAYYYGRIDRRPELLGENEDPKDTEKRMRDGIKEDSGSNNRKIIHTFLMRGPYGKPSSNQTTELFDTSSVPNPCEPTDWGKATWQAQPSSHPFDPKAVSGEPDVIPRAINYYRIYDPSKQGPKTNLPPANWQIIYNNPPVTLLEKALVEGFPFIFGMRLYNGASLENAEIDQKGIFVKPPMTKEWEGIGGHALMAVGFDSSKRLFLIQNSWGEDWPKNCKDKGMKGRFWMPYEWFEAVVEEKPITYDFWVVKCYGHK